jgi:alpha-glucosidase
LAFDRQAGHEGSMLEFTRDCIELRNTHRALREGTMDVISAGEQLLVFERTAAGKRLRCSFNLSETAVAFERAGKTLLQTGEARGGSLGPYGAIVEEIA